MVPWASKVDYVSWGKQREKIREMWDTKTTARFLCDITWQAAVNILGVIPNQHCTEILCIYELLDILSDICWLLCAVCGFCETPKSSNWAYYAEDAIETAMGRQKGHLWLWTLHPGNVAQGKWDAGASVINFKCSAVNCAFNLWYGHYTSASHTHVFRTHARVTQARSLSPLPTLPLSPQRPFINIDRFRPFTAYSLCCVSLCALLADLQWTFFVDFCHCIILWNLCQRS